MLLTKWNAKISPTSAATLSGEKAKPPEPAVMTIVLAAVVTANVQRMQKGAYMAFLEGD